MNGLQLSSDTDFSSARRFLFRDSYALETPSQVVSWWEKRRLAFNIAVGVTGLFSVTALVLSEFLASGRLPGGPPPIAIIAYGVLANVLYTTGWVAELLLRPVFGHRTGTVGAALFRYGLAFSVGLTLLPSGFAVVSLVIRLALKLF